MNSMIGRKVPLMVWGCPLIPMRGHRGGYNASLKKENKYFHIHIYILYYIIIWYCLYININNFFPRKNVEYMIFLVEIKIYIA